MSRIAPHIGMFIVAVLGAGCSLPGGTTTLQESVAKRVTVDPSKIVVDWIGENRFLVTNHSASEVTPNGFEIVAFKEGSQEPVPKKSIDLNITIEAGRSITLATQIESGADEILVARVTLDGFPRLAWPRLANRSLAQILISGSIVFETRQNTAGAEVMIAHFADAPGHIRTIAIGEERPLVGGYRWVPQHLNLDDKFIVFDFGSTKPVLVRDTTPVVGLQPINTTISKRPAWLLNEQEVAGQNLTLTPGVARGHVRLDDGVFETCGLTFFWPGSVCPVEFGPNITRVMSEFMVLRHEDPHYVHFQICETEMDPQGNPQPGACDSPMPVPSSGRCSPEFSDCFDISIQNAPTVTSKTATTNHTQFLADLFVPTTPQNWNQANLLPCDPLHIQPLCIQRYSLFKGRRSGHDRPICPFIENI